MIPAARKFDAKKEVDTARRRAYLFFVAFFRGAFSVGGFSVDHTPAPPPVGDHARRRWTGPAPPTPRTARRADDAAPVGDRPPPRPT